MTFLKTFLIGAASAAVVAMASSASAATVTAFASDCGTDIGGGTPLGVATGCSPDAARNMVGAIEFNAPVAGNDFFSLGLGGGLGLLVDPPAIEGGTVYEVTFFSNHLEAMDILGSNDGGATWTFLDRVTNNNVGPDVTAHMFSIAGSWSILHLLDATVDEYGAGTGSTDGFDIAGFSVSQVPLPAAGFLLLGGLGGLVALRRRKS